MIELYIDQEMSSYRPYPSWLYMSISLVTAAQCEMLLCLLMLLLGPWGRKADMAQHVLVKQDHADMLIMHIGLDYHCVENGLDGTWHADHAHYLMYGINCQLKWHFLQLGVVP